jgi:hypothetical protein
MVDGPLQPVEDDNTKAQQRRRPVWQLVGAGLLLLGLLLACVLWIPSWLYPPLTDNDVSDVTIAQSTKPDAAKIQELKDARLKLQNDARTTLLQGLGALLVLTGASIGASVTLRQVRATRDQIRETATASRNQLKLSEQGQVTDRYTRAVEQLGHEKAPVRLGALYSLQQLAQDNPEYRQTVVDVVCAYLRMPYIPPGQTELDAEQVQEKAPSANGRDRVPQPGPGGDPVREELQVRETAQRLLANHLRSPRLPSEPDAQLLLPSPQEAFWPGISLDLTGATLVDFTFPYTSVLSVEFVGATFWGAAGFSGSSWVAARFDGATFQNAAGFDWTTFHDGRFDGATFHGDARFDRATFRGTTGFTLATFHGDAGFDQATFHGDAGFDQATFHGDAGFTHATFHSRTRFERATFQNAARFDGAPFRGTAGFTSATFHGAAGFYEATFEGAAGFDWATFEGDTRFGGATFQSAARFTQTTFRGYATFDGAHVLHLDDDLGKGRGWPDGWTVRPNPADPSRGTLVRAKYA